MSISIALQLFSIRDEMEADFEGTLHIVKNMGYDGVEFAGLYGHTAEEVKKMCESIGITQVSAHIPIQEMMADYHILDTYAQIGCKYAVIPGIPEELRFGQPGYKDLLELIEKIGNYSNKLGMHFCYHNHFFEFDKVNGEYPLDILYNDVPADILMTQLDTCWVNIGGCDPAEYIKKYKGRAGTVHLKDFVGDKGRESFAKCQKIEKSENSAFGEFELRPVGMGVQNFPEIINAAKYAGAEWLIVEQDDPTHGKTPLECAELSIKYLKEICR